MSELQQCATHGKYRNANSLYKNAEGQLVCLPEDRCIVRVSNPASSDAVFPNLSCDLCNESLGEDQQMHEHIEKHHSALVDFCSWVTLKSKELKAQYVDRNGSVKKSLEPLGKLILETAEESDRGPAAFQVALDARDQLQVILRKAFPQCTVFVFGSCVASGVWDGIGDVDFTLIDPKRLENGEWPSDEPAAVNKITRCLRDAGFSYENLEPLSRTRVPIVKHHAESSIDWGRLGNPRNRTILFRFTNRISDELQKILISYFQKETLSFSDDRKTVKVLFATGKDAVETFINSHMIPKEPKSANTITPHWLKPQCPDIFSIDFDVSMRAHGLRTAAART